MNIVQDKFQERELCHTEEDAQHITCHTIIQNDNLQLPYIALASFSEPVHSDLNLSPFDLNLV